MEYLTTSTPTLALNNSCQVDSHFRYMFFTVSYSIIFIVGVIANGYVVWIFNRIYPTKSMSEIKIFMKNLITADLLFLMTLPLWIVYYYNNGNWIMPTFLCNMAGCCFFINTYCSVAFLCVITYNRFQAVTRPLETAHSAARKRGCYIAAAVWIPIVSSASYFLFATSTNEENLGTHNVTRCFEGYSSGNKPVAIINLLLIASFFVVFLIILVCTIVIIKTLLSQPAQMRQSVSAKHRALKMVCAVLAIFVVCFVPHHVIHGPWTLTVLQLWRVEDCEFRQQLNDAHQVTLCLMGTNCVLDPVIYCFLTKRFRRHLSEYIKSVTSSRKCSKQTTETGMEGVVPLNQCAVNLDNK